MANKKKVLIVDDSAVVRQVLKSTLESASDLEIMAAVQDPIFAMTRMEKNWPDVIVLDIEMPRMDGLTFLKKIMEERPTPVVMCSTLTEQGSSASMQALSYGAVGIVTKPKVGVKGFLSDSAAELIETVRSAASSNLKALKNSVAASKSVTPKKKVAPKLNADAVLSKGRSAPGTVSTDKVIAIGTSTGGTQALEAILPELPADTPPIVVVQHMPEKFTKAFAERLNKLCPMEVKEAEDNDSVTSGRVLIAPGGRHMLLQKNGPRLTVQVKDGPLVSRHKPSVDVLFRSVAKTVGKNTLGIIMTGMGDDGAAGLKEIHDTGAMTLAQNEASCVVYGMPDMAVKRGAVNKEIALDSIPREIVSFNS